jgi:dinuclear metal center YbgI/SA1388 family protein
MAMVKMPRLTDILGWLNSRYPAALAEDWDNVGLQVGDPAAEVTKILISLDIEQVALDKAEQLGVDLIISHHPLIFRPLKKITPTDTTGRLLMQAIKKDIALVSMHTNLDRAADGLNDWLASRLGVEQTVPLEPAQGGHYQKLVIYVPVGHEEQVMEAVFAAGGGHIGNYDRCSFRVQGTGSFRPGAESDPYIGLPGQFEEPAEVRLEFIFPVALTAKIVAKAVKSHPYEEVAYDLIPLANRRGDIGLGRIGRLPQPLTLEQFSGRVKQALQVENLRLCGGKERLITKVALCGGSGMSVYSEALRQGADCLVTGDVKFHEAQRARTDGLTLIDAGHFASEHFMVQELAQRLKEFISDRHYLTEVIEMDDERDPFSFV